MQNFRSFRPLGAVLWHPLSENLDFAPPLYNFKNLQSKSPKYGAMCFLFGPRIRVLRHPFTLLFLLEMWFLFNYFVCNLKYISRNIVLMILESLLRLKSVYSQLVLNIHISPNSCKLRMGRRPQHICQCWGWQWWWLWTCGRSWGRDGWCRGREHCEYCRSFDPCCRAGSRRQ